MAHNTSYDSPTTSPLLSLCSSCTEVGILLWGALWWRESLLKPPDPSPWCQALNAGFSSFPNSCFNDLSLDLRCLHHPQYSIYATLWGSAQMPPSEDVFHGCISCPNTHIQNYALFPMLQGHFMYSSSSHHLSVLPPGTEGRNTVLLWISNLTRDFNIVDAQ